MSALWKRRTAQRLAPTRWPQEDGLVQRTLSCSTTCSESEDTTTPPKVSRAHRQMLFEYDVLELLGQGSAGKVLRARKTDGAEVAIKVMQANDEEELSGRKKEFDILSRLDHPHLVKALDFLQSDFQAAVVLSYHPGQSLDLAVKAQGYFPESRARTLFFQLISAVQYLHEQGVLHRDVKPQNVLVSSDYETLHLADFNAAQAVQDGGALTMTGTMEYSAPEVLEGNSPSFGQDVWGCGLCLHFMLTGRLPQRLLSFSSLEAFASALRSSPVRWQLFKTCTSACTAVIAKCLHVEEESRPKAAEICAMDWISDLSKPKWLEVWRSRDDLAQ